MNGLSFSLLLLLHDKGCIPPH